MSLEAREPGILVLRQAQDEEAQNRAPPRSPRRRGSRPSPSGGEIGEKKQIRKALTQPSPTGRGLEPISPRPLGGEGGVRGSSTCSQVRSRLRGEPGGRGTDEHPPLPTLPPLKGGKGFHFPRHDAKRGWLKTPYPGYAGTSPRGGRFRCRGSSPSGGSGPEGRRGPYFTPHLTPPHTLLGLA